jgi:hypothetical protein
MNDSENPHGKLEHGNQGQTDISPIQEKCEKGSPVPDFAFRDFAISLPGWKNARA